MGLSVGIFSLQGGSNNSSAASLVTGTIESWVGMVEADGGLKQKPPGMHLKT